MTEKNGRDADLDPERHNPNVVPIRGYTLPPPPGWSDTDGTSASNSTPNGEGGSTNLDNPRDPSSLLTPEDYTVDGHLRCTYNRAKGTRCNNKVRPGTEACAFHHRKYGNPSHSAASDGAIKHPDDPTPMNKNQETRAQRVERVRAYLEMVAQSAVAAVQQVLEDEMGRPQDRLKAAEIILDRTVGRQLQVEQADAAEKQLDAEILELADTLLAPTGTDGGRPTPSPSAPDPSSPNQ